MRQGHAIWDKFSSWRSKVGQLCTIMVCFIWGHQSYGELKMGQHEIQSGKDGGHSEATLCGFL
jgi:hypothetical protein